MSHDEPAISRALLLAAAALTASALCLLLVFFLVARGNVAPAPADPSPRVIAPDTMRVIVGKGEFDGEGLRITGYQRQQGLYHAVAVWQGDLPARALRVLRYKLDWDEPMNSVKFTWRRADDPGTVHSTPLYRHGDGWGTIDLDDIGPWRGQVVEVGVYAVADSAARSPRILGLSLEPDRWSAEIEHGLTTWTAFRGWNIRSINFLLATPREGEPSPLPVVAGWAALACLLLAIAGATVVAVPRLSYALVLLAAWVLVDLLWQWQLNLQLSEARDRFAGKTMHERHLADEDAHIYRYVHRLRDQFLPDEPARIVIAHPASGHDYDRLKTQYYLLPHNVYNFGRGPFKRGFLEGDYVLVLGQTSNPRFDARSGELVWRRGLRLPAERLDTHPRGSLYRISRLEHAPVSEGQP